MKALLAAGSVIVALVSGASPRGAPLVAGGHVQLATVKGTVTEFAWETAPDDYPRGSGR